MKEFVLRDEAERSLYASVYGAAYQHALPSRGSDNQEGFFDECGSCLAHKRYGCTPCSVTRNENYGRKPPAVVAAAAARRAVIDLRAASGEDMRCASISPHGQRCALVEFHYDKNDSQHKSHAWSLSVPKGETFEMWGE